jgi:hypothetical protein
LSHCSTGAQIPRSTYAFRAQECCAQTRARNDSFSLFCHIGEPCFIGSFAEHHFITSFRRAKRGEILFHGSTGAEIPRSTYAFSAQECCAQTRARSNSFSLFCHIGEPCFIGSFAEHHFITSFRRAKRGEILFQGSIGAQIPRSTYSAQTRARNDCKKEDSFLRKALCFVIAALGHLSWLGCQE